MSTFEVEMKFRLERNRDVVLQGVLPYAANTEPKIVRQEDHYFAHPCRDFRETDEAFRLRRVGEDRYLTYKGPLLDAISKTREEIEVQVGFDDAGQQQMVAILESLGFRLAGRVAKQRETYTLNWSGLRVDIAFDSVEQLGEFVELETLADEGSWEAARDQLRRFATSLGFQESVRASYLQLLLERSAVE